MEIVVVGDGVTVTVRDKLVDGVLKTWYTIVSSSTTESSILLWCGSCTRMSCPIMGPANPCTYMLIVEDLLANGVSSLSLGYISTQSRRKASTVDFRSRNPPVTVASVTHACEGQLESTQHTEA